MNSAANLAESCTAMAFGTPISTHRWADADALNAGLRARILAAERADKGVLRSNIGGWHSAPDLLASDDQHVAAFKARLVRYARDLTALVIADPARKLDMKIDAWANVSRDGDYNGVHDHPGAHWSGVYYVSAGTPAPNANPHNAMLELLDPRVGVNMLALPGSVFEGRYLIAPLPGLMVFFPSWIKHLVHPFRGEGERISISWNIEITG